MFESLKRKRMQIMEQIVDKRQRMPSVERRKMVETEYNQFIKTMNNIIPVANASSSSNAGPFSKRSLASNQPIRDSFQLSMSPTVKDLQKPVTDRQSLANQFYQRSEAIESPKKVASPQKMNQMNFYKPVQPVNMQTNLNQMKEENSVHQSEPKVEDQQIKFAGNASIQQSSVNNSDAIFFTSQFKDFIDRQYSPLKQQPKEQLVKVLEQAQIQVNKIEQNNINQQEPQSRLIKQEPVKQQRTLKSNPSGQSLNLSNDSSLKLSLQDSAVHQAVTKKLTHQLVVDSLGNSKFEESFRNIVLMFVNKQNFIDLIEFKKQIQLMRNVDLLRKKYVINELMIKHEMIFQLRKNQIKIGHFREAKKKEQLQARFIGWRDTVFQKLQRVQAFKTKKQKDTLQGSFRAFKMLLFDRKINNQIDLYYLSKIFMAFKNIAEKQKKRSNQKAYRCYFRNLKRRMFQFFKQGVRAHQREIMLNQVADEHYYLNLLRTTFDAWKQIYPRQQRYVRLAMTTRNQLRQTFDKKLLQTKTFDFKEIR